MTASCQAYTLPVATSVRTSAADFGVVTLTAMAFCCAPPSAAVAASAANAMEGGDYQGCRKERH